MRVLFFMPYSIQAAGCRFRVHQFLPYLRANGVECELRELVTPELYEILYEPGQRLRKAALFARRAAQRLVDLRDARDFDVLFIYRECFPFGPALMEKYLRGIGRPVVFDYDDAIYLPDSSPFKDFVRRPAKTNDIIRLSDQVIVCNEHLRGFSAAYNKNVWVIPTSVDTEGEYSMREYREPLPPEGKRPVRLGWVGSHSTAKYLERLTAVVQRIAARYPVELFVVGAGREFSIPGVSIVNKAWTLESEADDFRSIDIGLYPLHDDLWEQGKTSFKTIQYMAAGVPGVVSRVGAALGIVKDDDNGFLASSDDEWFSKIARLIEDPGLRRRIAESGRRSAVAGFSVSANAPKLLEVLAAAVSGSGALQMSR